MIFVLVLAGLTGLLALQTFRVAGVYLYSRQVKPPHCACQEQFCPAHLLGEAMELTHRQLKVDLLRKSATLMVAVAMTAFLYYLT